MNPTEMSSGKGSNGLSELPDSSPKSSSPEKDRESLKALLAEARQTRQVLEDFESAVKAGSYPGQHMIALAKGLSFVSAVLSQTKAHVFNLQSRLEKPDGPTPISPESGNA